MDPNKTNDPNNTDPINSGSATSDQVISNAQNPTQGDPASIQFDQDQPTHTPSSDQPDKVQSGDTILNPATPESVITSPHVPKKYGGKKVIATIFGVVLLIGAIASGVYMVQTQQIRLGQAWDCSLYVFNMSDSGVVTVQNNSSRNEVSQQAMVYVNNVLVQTFDVPTLNSGESATLGTVTVPTATGFSWRIDGSKDCDNQGEYAPVSPTQPPVSAKCDGVKAYDTEWNLLGAEQLSSLKAGDVLRLSVRGVTSQGTIDKARFTANGDAIGETTEKKPGGEEFYLDYTIPEGATQFNFTGQVYHSTLGWF